MDPIEMGLPLALGPENLGAETTIRLLASFGVTCGLCNEG